MEDFYYAGGLRALLAQLATVPGALHPDRLTVTGRTLGEQTGRRRGLQRGRDPLRQTALAAEGGLAVLRGNLAPDGAVIKHIAAEPRLLKHTGPAVVFDNYRRDAASGSTTRRWASPPDSVLVLRDAGPLGGPGHAGVRHAADPGLPARRRACGTWCGSPMRG